MVEIDFGGEARVGGEVSERGVVGAGWEASASVAAPTIRQAIALLAAALAIVSAPFRARAEEAPRAHARDQLTIPPGPSPDNPYAIPVPNPRAPIYQWTKAGEYDTEAACQRERKKWDKLRSVGELPICIPIEAWWNRTPLPTIPKVMPR